MLNLDWFTARSKNKRKAGELYGAVVAAARNPVIFRDLGVADTPEGRFEILTLMLFLAVNRLQAAGPGGEPQAQRMIETFVVDMDDCMRELGVGDLTVPKKVRKAAAAFYERGAAYRQALANSDSGALSQALAGYVFAGRNDAPARRLSDYARATQAALAHVSDADARDGRMIFPPIAASRETSP